LVSSSVDLASKGGAFGSSRFFALISALSCAAVTLLAISSIAALAGAVSGIETV